MGFVAGLELNCQVAATSMAGFAMLATSDSGASVHRVYNAVFHRFKVLWVICVCFALNVGGERHMNAGDTTAKTAVRVTSMRPPHLFSPGRTGHGPNATPGSAPTQ